MICALLLLVVHSWSIPLQSTGGPTTPPVTITIPAVPDVPEAALLKATLTLNAHRSITSHTGFGWYSFGADYFIVTMFVAGEAVDTKLVRIPSYSGFITGTHPHVHDWRGTLDMQHDLDVGLVTSDLEVGFRVVRWYSNQLKGIGSGSLTQYAFWGADGSVVYD